MMSRRRSRLSYSRARLSPLILVTRRRCVVNSRSLIGTPLPPAKTPDEMTSRSYWSRTRLRLTRVSVALISIATSLTVTLAKADDVLPKRTEFVRYQPMLTRSPFAVATAPAAPAAAPDFARDLYVANAAHSPDGDLVTIASTTDRNFKKYLTTKAPVDGFALAAVDWSDKIGQTNVTITKDGKYATLTFNQALLAQAANNGQQLINPV